MNLATQWAFLFGFAAMLVPAYCLRLHRIFADRSFSGTVIEVNLRHKTEYKMIVLTTKYIRYLDFKVECPSGEVMVKKIKIDDTYSEDIQRYYAVGDTVHFYKGVKLPKKDPNYVQIKTFEYRLCIVCGYFAETRHERCSRCKSSIVA
jgi:hypothetical protein